MITLVFCGDIMVCPYLKRYTEEFDKSNTPYEVLFWNRSARKITVPDNYFYYESKCDDLDGKVKKLNDFRGFRRWIVSHLKTHKTDGLVCCQPLQVFYYAIN